MSSFSSLSIRRALALTVAWLAFAALAHAQKPAPQLTKPPALLKFVEAPYPQLEPKPTGDVGVTLLVLIGVDGKVADVKVTQSAGPAFDEPALAAVRQFEFSPAEVDHKPSPINIEYRYVFTQRVEKVLPTTGVLAGIVKDLDKKPVANVQITGGGATVTTDEAGRFRIADLPAGKVTLTLRGERLSPLQTEETVVAGEELEVSYKVALAAAPGEPSDDLEILVTAPPTIQRDVVSTKVSAEQARSVPGAQGDVVRVVESLPGVARSAVGTGNLIVWGSGPDDTKTYVDGVPIPRLYHQGGLRSTVYSGYVNAVELVPGGYGAGYGRGLGGVLRVETQTPDKVGTHGQAAVDLWDASGMVTQSISPRLRATAAGRVSLIDQFSKALNSDVSAYVPIPRYRDAQLRTSYALKNGDRIDVVGILSMDHTLRGVPAADPALATREQVDTSFYRLYANYVHSDSHGSRSAVTPFVGFGTSNTKTSYGTIGTALGDNDFEVGLRAYHAARVASFFTLEGGIDVLAEGHDVSRRGSLGLPAREGDVRVFGQPPPDQVGYDAFKTARVSVAPYVEGDFALANDKLHIVPGVRVDPNFRSVSRKVPPVAGQPDIGLFAQNLAVEPRLAIRYRAAEKLGLHAATGIYHQQPAVADLSSVFGNPTLGTSRAIHNVLGTNIQAMEKLNIQLTGFATFLDHLTMRNTDPAPRNAEALLNTGKGHTFGVQTLVRRELANNVFGWVSYTLSRAERKNAPSTPWRLFDYDQTHVLSTVLVWTPSKGFEVGTRFRVASGYPRTAVIGTYYDALRDRTQPIFGHQNGIRIPLFMQLDLRASQTFELGDTKGQVYLEVQNVTNRQNEEELVYSADFTRRGSIKSLPILPVAGVSWNF